MILLYNKLKYNIIALILVPIIAWPGIVFVEPITSKEYMVPIAFIAFSLIIFIFGLSNTTKLVTSKKFLLSSKVAKSSYTVTSIVYTNILGIGFICIVSLTKYTLTLFKIGSMDNIVDTLFVLLVVVALVSSLKVIMAYFDMIALTLAAVVASPIIVVAKYSFVYFRFREAISKDKAGILFLIGTLVYIAINALSVIYSTYLYKNRRFMDSYWINQEE
jgi:hypothetical protein